MKVWKVTEHADLIVELAKLFEVGTYVELGVRKAYTFNKVAPFVKRAVGVDLVNMGRVTPAANVQLIIASTEDTAAKWVDPIDMLFIDADHARDAVLRDFDLWSPFVREDTGLILLHDTYPVAESLCVPGYCDNAWEAAEIIRKRPKYNRAFEIVTLPGPYAGLSIIRKASKQLGWRQK